MAGPWPESMMMRACFHAGDEAGDARFHVADEHGAVGDLPARRAELRGFALHMILIPRPAN